jgi:hypothetical protein
VPVRVIVEFKGPSQRQQIWQAVAFLVFLELGWCFGRIYHLW